MVEPTSSISAAPAPRRLSKLQIVLLLGPFVLIAIEVVCLSFKVDFSGGWMRMLASPAVFAIVFFSAALFLMHEGRHLAETIHPGKLRARIVWFLVNLATYWAFFRFTHFLNAHKAAQFSKPYSATWIALALFVGMSVCLTFISWGTLIAWLRPRWDRLLGCVAIGLTLAVLTSSIQQTWIYTAQHTIPLSGRVLEFFGHTSVVAKVAPNASPILGVRPLPQIIVTPNCAEMESLAAFAMMGIVLMISGGTQVHQIRLVTVIAGGLVVFFLLNAVRLALLVQAGYWTEKTGTCVRLAHSRVSFITFLTLSVVVYLVTQYWWRKRASRENGLDTVA